MTTHRGDRGFIPFRVKWARAGHEGSPNRYTSPDIAALGRELTEKELAFCEHYARLRNAEQAALAAGYAPNNARKNAWNILNRPHVQEYLNVLANSARERATISIVEVMDELAAIAFASPFDYLEQDDRGLWRTKSPADLSDRQQSALKRIVVRQGPCGRRSRSSGGVTVVGADGEVCEYELHDRLKALSMLGRHLGLFDAGARPAQSGNPFADLPQEKLDELAQVFERALDASS